MEERNTRNLGCPTFIAEKSAGGGRFDQLREKHPNAYRPWDKAQDEKLQELLLKEFLLTVQKH